MHLIWLVILLLATLARPVQAGFSSMYVFGDSVSSVTDSPGPPNYHGNRYSNGRVWVEVLAQRQGLTLTTNQNISFFGHYSPILVSNVNNFAAPADAATALFVVWVNNADLVGCTFEISFPYDATDIPLWTNKLNLALSNYSTAFQTLYSKGARTILAPSPVDVSRAPNYSGNSSADKAFIRQRSLEFNTRFTSLMGQLQNSLTNLTIVVPDMFSQFDELFAHPAVYGFTNTTGDALDADLPNYSFTGPGTNFLFWDYINPGARSQEIFADKAQSVLTPARVAALTKVNGSNQLSVVNLPLGLGGFVESSTNLLSWTAVQSFNSTNSSQAIIVPVSGPKQYYRLRFPYVWTWP